jgi:hypothetical protein
MKAKVSLRKALEDPELLGSVLSGPSWHAWRSLLLAANGEALTSEELLTFTKYTGREAAPTKRVDELWCAVGRRGGKSRAMATMAAYYGGLCDYSRKLARGERGLVLLIAKDKRAAKVSLDYAEGAFDSTLCCDNSSKSAVAKSWFWTTASPLKFELQLFVAFVV